MIKSHVTTHLIELRQRLLITLGFWLVASVLCYLYATPLIWHFLTAPFINTLKIASPTFYFFDLPGAFLLHLKMACYSGVAFTVPVLLWHLWRFLKPGLYAREQRHLRLFFLGAPLLFIGGVLFCYYFILSNAWQFFMLYEMPAKQGSAQLAYLPQIDLYIDLTLNLLLAFGASFELPIILISLSLCHLISSSGLAEKRRYVIVGLFIFAAVVTPPDILSQVALAIPLWLLFEGTIVIIRLLEKPKKK